MKWENVPNNIEDHLGFVYLITNLKNDKRYIGKKQFWKQIRRKPLKGKKRVRLDRVESDWNNYYGSSNKLLADIELYGKAFFKREILTCYDSKFDLAYGELEAQMCADVLYSKEYYNEIINVRLRKVLK